MLGQPDRGEFYEMQPAEVATRLTVAPLPGQVSGPVATDGTFTFSPYKKGDSQVVWDIRMLGDQFASFTANLEPESGGTTVTVQFDFADSSLGNAARADLGDGQELIGAVFRLGLLEHVDSVLDGKPFDTDRFGKDMAAYFISNPGVVKAYEKRIAELDAAGGPMALRGAVEERLIADAQFHGDGSYPMGSDPALASDQASGYDPSQDAAATMGEDPSAGLDYGEGSDPSGDW